MVGTFRPLGGIAMTVILTACASTGQKPDAVSAHAPRQEPLALLYVANEGVLVSSGESKVLIDALFDKPNPEYRAPSPDVLEKIMKGDAPYDGVDLVLVTHDHPDHFDASLAARYLAASPGTVLVGPADAVAAMRAAASDWASIEPRVVSLDVEIGEKTKKELKGISLAALRTKHSGEQESPMNLMYLFELGGWRVFHEGDSTGKAGVCTDSVLGAAAVDLALVHFWFPLDPDCARFLQESLRPSHIALMHLPIRLESDAPGKIDQIRKYYEDLFLMLPGMQKRVFEKAGGTPTRNRPVSGT
jgi:L-ascorbate metabolism protein UlaG (beta-lactamase superfamily)